MRKKLTAFLTLSVILILAAVAGAAEAPIGTATGVAVVKSEGVALRADNIAEVKKKAIDQALKNAVSHSLDRMIDAEGLQGLDIPSSGVMSDPFSYIMNYRILSEGWITHMESIPQIAEELPKSYDFFGENPGGLELYHIWIEATVDEARLHSALSAVTVNHDAPATSVTVTILGVDDYATFRALVDSLKRVPSIKDISYSSFYKGRTVLALKSTSNGETLSERIAREVPGDFAVIPAGPRMIIIRAALSQ